MKRRFRDVQRFENKRDAEEYIAEVKRTVSPTNLKKITLKPINEEKHTPGYSSPSGMGYSSRGTTVSYTWKVIVTSEY